MEELEGGGTLTLFRMEGAEEAVHGGSNLETSLLVRDVQCLALARVIHFRFHHTNWRLGGRTMGLGMQTQLSRTREVWDKKKCEGKVWCSGAVSGM